LVMRLIKARGRNRAIRSRNWIYEGPKVKVSSSNVNSRGLNGANATAEWPVTLGGAVLKIPFTTLKTGDVIMILFTPRY